MLALQCVSVLALPVAFCCCLAMAAEHVGDGSDLNASPAGTNEACPHHGGEGPTPAGDGDGCGNLDQLVVLLAGLTGVLDTGSMAVPTLVPAEAVTPALIAPTAYTRSVESPPPRT